MQHTVSLSQFCLCVSPSVCQMSVLWQNWMKHCGYFDTTRNGNHCGLLTTTAVGGWCPLPCEMFAESYRQVFLVVCSHLHWSVMVCTAVTRYAFSDHFWGPPVIRQTGTSDCRLSKGVLSKKRPGYSPRATADHCRSLLHRWQEDACLVTAECRPVQALS